MRQPMTSTARSRSHSCCWKRCALTFISILSCDTLLSVQLMRRHQASNEGEDPSPLLCSPLCLSPFSVRKVGPMIAPLDPGHEFPGVLKGQRAEGEYHCEEPPQL